MASIAKQVSELGDAKLRKILATVTSQKKSDTASKSSRIEKDWRW